MVGMEEHDMHSKPPICHNVVTAVHKGVGARGKLQLHCAHAAPTVASGGNCSSAMDSSVQQRSAASSMSTRPTN
jgi:hypothetical protein